VFTKSAAFYDAIYSFKDYAQEAARVYMLIQQHKATDGNTLLDVACGTGAHAVHLAQHYALEGLDLDAELLAMARGRLPEVTFHHADMRNFRLGREYDALVCLFSSIGYVVTLEALRETLQTFAAHVRPGGIVVVEPWFAPGQMQGHGVWARFVDEPELKIARMSTVELQERVSILNFHYLVGTPDGMTTFEERHKLGLFTPDEYAEAFTNAGLTHDYDSEGLTGRGLHLGVRPL
jgi:ubiquinone/menaquinone biosynthesis C-methylase UbiE